MAISLLLALVGWVFPALKSVASYAKGNSQTVSQTPNLSGEKEANNTSKVGGSENEGEPSKTEITQSNEPQQTTNNASKSSPSRNQQTRERIVSETVGTPIGYKSYSKEEVIQLIKDYSAQYGISADLPLRVAN